MAFEAMTDKFSNALSNLTKRGKITESDVNETLREIRLNLLEADVNFKVVKQFIAGVKEKATNEKVLNELNAAQTITKIVKDELVEILGGENKQLELKKDKFEVIMTLGLQGAGKTTSISKLAKYYAKTYDKKPFFIAADIYRPAAIDQLETLAHDLGYDVYANRNEKNVTKIVLEGIEKAKEARADLVFIDTAGRLQIDEALMNELRDINEKVKPKYKVLVIDSMIGQEAVNVATEFNNELDVDGVMLTKLDGDTRGGAAISITTATGLPIMYVGNGEKADDLELFHPDRIAGRILGMGDVLTLIEQVESKIDTEKAKKGTEKFLKGDFDFEDFLDQLQQLKNLGPLGNLLKMIPGVGKQMRQAMDNVDQDQFKFVEAIIQSMTVEERRNPKLVEIYSRKQRIIKGSGRSAQEVNRLLKQFGEMKKMMKQMGKMKKGKNGMPDLSSLGGMGGMKFPGM